MRRKRHKHEEHQNHERWVISYADMITLLFALFVVLYALGLDKIEVVARSIAFAFHFEGEGRTKQEGLFDSGGLGGYLAEAPPLLNAQSGPMKEFLSEQLREEFEEVTGHSLEVRMHDDRITFRAPLAGFFAPGSANYRKDVVPWLKKLLGETARMSTQTTVAIEAPDLRIGTNPDNTALRTSGLCHQRLDYAIRFFRYHMTESPEHVRTEFGFMRDWPGGTGGDWEKAGTITFAFGNPSR
jgi:hypothetical protein